MAKGKSLGWAEKDIDSLIEITPADIERARVWWTTNAPKAAKTILDAEPVNDAV